MRKVMWMAAMALTLAGCAQAQEAASSAAPPAFATCQEAADHYAAKAGQALVLPIAYKVYRVIKPNSMVTMDYNPERLNVYTDDYGIIIKARCG